MFNCSSILLDLCSLEATGDSSNSSTRTKFKIVLVAAVKAVVALAVHGRHSHLTAPNSDTVDVTVAHALYYPFFQCYFCCNQEMEADGLQGHSSS